MRVLLVGGTGPVGQAAVREPDPLEATIAQIDWLWEQRAALER
jgi:uncharacterized protein YbjT (DUF2867 family)